MPRLQDPPLVFFDSSREPPQLVIAKPPGAGKPDRSEPKLRRGAVAPDMDVGRFIPFGRVEKERIRTYDVDRRHVLVPSGGLSFPPPVKYTSFAMRFNGTAPAARADQFSV
jgi:hypothetical protein